MRKRSLAVACVVFGVALGPAGGAGAGEEPGTGLVSFALTANAPGVALEGLYRDIALTVPDTTSTLSTGGVGTGFAALTWPGPILGNLGTTALVLNDNVPSAATVLNDPIRAESHSGGVQKANYGMTPGPLMASTATRVSATASSVIGAGTALPIGSLGAVTGSSSTTLVGPTSAVSTATSNVVDLSLAGGAITVAAVVSTARTTTDGVKATATGSTVVTGMRVGGVPVSVDGAGLHVAGTAVGNPLSQDTLNGVIESLGITAVVTKPTVVKTSSSARYSASALVLVFSRGVDKYALTVGRAAAVVAVSRTAHDPALTIGLPSTGPPSAGVPESPGRAPGQLPSSGLANMPVLLVPREVSGTVPPPVVERPVIGTGPVPAAFTNLLAGGAPALLLLPLLLLVGALGFFLPHLAERFLVGLGGAECEDEQG